MNVLISSASYVFTDHLPGGEFQIAHAVAAGLAARGHRVHVLCPRADLRHPMPNLTVYVLGNFDFIGTASYGRYRLEWWRFAWLSYRKARELVRSAGIDVVHHIRPAVKGRFSLCCDLGPPFVFGPISPAWPVEVAETSTPSGTWRDALLNRLADRINMMVGHRLYARTLRNAAALPVSSRQSLPLLPENRRAAATVIPFGVDSRLFCPESERPPGSDILFVGVLEPRKGIDYLLSAFAQVLKRHPAARLTLVGRGRDAQRYADLSTELGISEAVTFTGPVPFDGVVDYFRRCDIFCLPSIGEPFGISLLQAMSCGKPVVATRSGGVPEFVENHRSGLLVEPADADALEGALLTLLSDVGMRQHMGSYNRTLCLDRYSWDATVDRIEALYRELVPNASASRPLHDRV